MKNYKCKQCNNLLNNIRGKVFCSQDCFKQYQKSIKVSIKCLECGCVKYYKPSVLKRKDGGKYCSRNCYHKSKIGIKLSKDTCKKLSESKRGLFAGEKNPMWKGGITPINQLVRNSTKYKNWRKEIFERDNYTCQECGARNGNGSNVYLHADHILPFALFKESRFDLDNGRTLCIDCHKKTPTWGAKTLKFIDKCYA